jgi:SAM-dependent methyltransferase
MKGYTNSSYGDGFAEVYDRWYDGMGDLGGCVGRLSTLAGTTPVLELGVGTGRVALPLSSRVTGYTGVDASPEMLDRLRSKVGAERITTVEGDMAEVPVAAGARYGLVFFSYNTFFNITSVEGQQRCLERSAAVLVDGGHLVIEAFVPDDDPPDIEGVIVPTRMTLDTVVLTATMRDPVAQTIAGQHIELLEGRPQLHPWFIRYTRPDELDVMAGAAGLTLVERTEGWRNEPFDDDSSHHVSVYRQT